MDSRYATLSLTPSTSRNCSDAAPGTTPDLQVAPPSVVTVNLPARPLAQTTRLLTGLPATPPPLPPLFSAVSGGRRAGCSGGVPDAAPAPTRSAAATTADDIHLKG